MKARTVLLLVAAMFFFIGEMGCEKGNVDGYENEFNKVIQGNWQLVGQNVSDGTPSKLLPIENGYVIQFNSNGIVSSDLFACTGKYNLEQGNILKIDFSCDAKENALFLFIAKISFYEGNKEVLALSHPNSDEPYTLMFKRVN